MIEANNHLNRQALQDFSHEHLEDYTLWLEQQDANIHQYILDVRAEWDRRERAGYYEQT